MRIRYDKRADAMYIRFSEEAYKESDEVRDGFIVDYGKDGKIIGLEILDVSQNLPKDAVSKVVFERLPKKKSELTA